MYIAQLYLTIGVMLFFNSFLADESLDIAVHDTYFVISNQQILILLAGIYALFAIVHYVTIKLRKSLLKSLSWLHLILTTSGLVVLAVLISNSIENPTNTVDYSVYDSFDKVNSVMDWNLWISILVLTVFLAQIVFLFNVVRAFVSKE